MTTQSLAIVLSTQDVPFIFDYTPYIYYLPVIGLVFFKFINYI